jgi:hypothetical protein
VYYLLRTEDSSIDYQLFTMSDPTDFRFFLHVLDEVPDTIAQCLNTKNPIQMFITQTTANDLYHLTINFVGQIQRPAITVTAQRLGPDSFGPVRVN